MSFILDALKKAERDRDLARVPTLSTVHIPVLMTGRRIGLWATAGVLLVAGGLSIWLWRPAPSTTPRTPAEPQAAVAFPATPAAPARAVDAPSPGPVTPGPPRPVAREQPK